MKAEIKNEETKNDKVISSLVHLFTNLYVWNVQNATRMIAGIGLQVACVVLLPQLLSSGPRDSPLMLSIGEGSL